jgi:hypothetical protein
MKLSEIAEKLQLSLRSGQDHLDVEVARGYASDLMSDVLANADSGDLWITLQTHQNIVAVSVMKSLAGVILVNGREPMADTLEKAVAEGMPIMVSDLPAFELIGRLYKLGIRGT